MTQDDIDEWLEDNRAVRGHEIRFFLAWASSRGIGPEVHVQTPGRSVIGRMLEEEERQECLKHCISDEQLPLDVRVAGALVALYGLTISRIVRLTHTDIQPREGDVYLRIDKSPLVLPPRLAEIIDQLAQTARPTGAIGRTIRRTAWLLPGRQPGQHVTAGFLGRKLVQYGIQARPTRNAAILALAKDLPAAVLADLLGMHVITAETLGQDRISRLGALHHCTLRSQLDRGVSGIARDDAEGHRDPAAVMDNKRHLVRGRHARRPRPFR